MLPGGIGKIMKSFSFHTIQWLSITYMSILVSPKALQLNKCKITHSIFKILSQKDVSCQNWFSSHFLWRWEKRRADARSNRSFTSSKWANNRGISRVKAMKIWDHSSRVKTHGLEDMVSYFARFGTDAAKMLQWVTNDVTLLRNGENVTTECHGKPQDFNALLLSCVLGRILEHHECWTKTMDKISHLHFTQSKCRNNR